MSTLMTAIDEEPSVAFTVAGTRPIPAAMFNSASIYVRPKAIGVCLAQRRDLLKLGP